MRRRQTVSALVVAAALLALGALGQHLEIGGAHLTATGSALVAGLAVLLAVFEVKALTRDFEARVAQRTAELAASERRFRSLVEHSSDVVAVVDPGSLTFRYVSDSLVRVFGHGPRALLDKSMLSGVHPDDRAELEAVVEAVLAERGAVAVTGLRVRHADGSWRQVETTVKNLVDDPAIRGLVLNTRDLTEQVRLEEQLSHQASHDELTELPNRALFADRVELALAAGERSGAPVTVLYLDLDGFKNVNETFGHAVGDLLLAEVADRLVSCMRSADTVARLGGDEFAVLLSDTSSADRGERVAKRVAAIFDVPFTVDDRELSLGASIGIAESSGVDDAGDLLSRADAAMYLAKHRGRGGIEHFDPATHVDVTERVTLESELRQALDRDQLFVEYQPIVDIETGHVEEVEALVRWRHPERGVVSPAEFVPIAEDAGLIGPIGTWVLLESCRQVRWWQRHLPHREQLGVSVNLSVSQVRQADIVEQVAGVLAETGLEPSRLTLEITESVLMDDVDEVVERLRRFKELGVDLAIDDFGTGYSSLSYLRKFPIDILKVDRLFVQGLGHGPEESALARAIIKLGRTFRLRTVAEGIESQEQADALVRMGCGLGQGYLFARPLPAARLEELLSVAGGAVRARRVATPATPAGPAEQHALTGRRARSSRR